MAQILSHGVPVRVNGVGDLKAALQYSNHRSIDQYTGRFGAKVAEDVRLGRAFIFPREMASRIPGLRVSPVGVAVSATKVRIIHDLTLAFSNPGVNGIPISSRRLSVNWVTCYGTLFGGYYFYAAPLHPMPTSC